MAKMLFLPPRELFLDRREKIEANNKEFVYQREEFEANNKDFLSRRELFLDQREKIETNKELFLPRKKRFLDQRELLVAQREFFAKMIWEFRVVYHMVCKLQKKYNKKAGKKENTHYIWPNYMRNIINIGI